MTKRVDPRRIGMPAWLRVLTCAASVVALVSCESRDEQEYHLGIAAPFTGQEGAAVYGENIRNAVELAVAEINAREGIQGRRIVTHYEDTQLLAPQAIAAVQDLVSQNGVKVIIGPVASSSTIAAAPFAERDSVILISPASTSNEISGLSPFVFRTIAPDNLEAEAMARFAMEQGYHRFAIAFVDNAGTRGPAEVFRSAVQRSGGTVVAYEVVPQGSTDVRTQMVKLSQSRPDAVYLLGYALELGSMLRQFREANASIPILSFQVMEEPKVREIAGTAAEGVVFTTPTIYGQFASGRSRQFIDAYKARYGKDPGIFAANAYDAVGVLAQVIDSVGFEVDGIRNALRNVRGYNGASGQFDINERGDSNQQPRFMIVRNGQLELYQPGPPQQTGQPDA